MNILIYTKRTTNRISYIFNLIFKELSGVGYKITNDLEEFNKSTYIKVAYSKTYIADCVYFKAANLLFERNVYSHDMSICEYKGLNVFYGHDDSNSALPFDPFASAFMIVSRYEEFLTDERDIHGRFTAAQSLAFKYCFLYKPVVNICADFIFNVIREKYSQLLRIQNKFVFTPTYDIDSAYAYKHKGIGRTFIGYAKNILIDRSFKSVLSRSKVLLNLMADPFDTFDYQLELQKKYNLNPIYFIQFGCYGKFDKNISVYNNSFRSLVKRLADNAQIGIHGSYASNGNKRLYSKEVEDLSNLVYFDITKNRQHYLLLSVDKKTYRCIINCGIEEDYTMGYADMPGFRAGICNPYKFYDLEYDMESNLIIHPLTYMDGTFNDYMKLSIDEAKLLIKQLMDEVKLAKGEFVSLWHNESLNDKYRWAGWREVYEYTIREACSE